MRRQKGRPGLWIALFCSLVFVQFQASAGIRIPVPRQSVLATVSVSTESTAERKSRSLAMSFWIFRKKNFRSRDLPQEIF